MNTRVMKIEDYDAVYQLWVNTPGMGLNTTDDSREGIERYLRRNPSTCFVAEESGEIIGVILAGHDGRRGYLYHAAVSMKHRNKGIASVLVDCAMKALQREGITKTALVVFSKNELGNGFWKKRGFMSREDLVYRNKNIIELSRINT